MIAEVERKYHPYTLWEDYQAGFYENISGEVKRGLIERAIEILSSPENCHKYMGMVIRDWPNSCEHNLTNKQLNRIAYIGQAACCIAYGVPSTITMEAWDLIPEEKQKEADKIAEFYLNEWMIEYAQKKDRD